MQMSKEMLSSINYSENRFLIDWFSFSSRIDSFETMAALLGMSDCNWELMKGVQGYTYRYYFEGISIHWAGDNAFRFSGTDIALRALESPLPERAITSICMEPSASRTPSQAFASATLSSSTPYEESI